MSAGGLKHSAGVAQSAPLGRPGGRRSRSLPPGRLGAQPAERSAAPGQCFARACLQGGPGAALRGAGEPLWQPVLRPDAAGRCRVLHVSFIGPADPEHDASMHAPPVRRLHGQRLPAVRAPHTAVHPVVGACPAGRWQRCIVVPTRGAVHPARTAPTLTSRRARSQARRRLPGSVCLAS